MFPIREITIEDVKAHQDKYILVDVREAQELKGPQGQIEGVILATLGPGLAHFLTSADPTKEYVFICLGGYRSAKACEIAQAYGFRYVYNMTGGMMAWNERIKP